MNTNTSKKNTQKDTQWLGDALKNVQNLDELKKFIQEYNSSLKSEFTASNYYLECLEKHGLSLTDINKFIKNSPINNKPIIDRTYVSHFLGARKSLSRDNMFILALLGKLSIDETETFLKYAGIRGFYDKDKRDSLLKFAFKKMDEQNDPLDYYVEVEDFLQKQNERPLCKKLAVGFVEEDHPVNTKISYETETAILSEGLGKITDTVQLSQYFQEHQNDITSEISMRRHRVAAYILETCMNKGITPNNLIKNINNYCLDASSIYHLFHINNNKTIKTFTRDNIIAIGIIAELSIEQINKALKYNNNAPLYVKDIRDLYLMFCILNHYDYYKTEDELAKQCLHPLYKERQDKEDDKQLNKNS